MHRRGKKEKYNIPTSVRPRKRSDSYGLIEYIEKEGEIFREGFLPGGSGEVDKREEEKGKHNFPLV